MADTKISALTTGTTPAVGDEFPIARSGANYKLTWAQMHTFTNGISVQGLTVGRGVGAVATNTALGIDVLASNTTGNYNTVVGWKAMYSNTTGGYNTAIGYGALYNNTGAGYNTAVGYIAGDLVTAGTGNATSVDSVYLGYDTRASADGNTNEIVIGKAARGNGSNTVTLGNASIVTTVLRGNVGIGTTGPTANLHVSASTTARASLCVPHGTAPTSPVDGDIWTTTAGLYVRINGGTVGPLS